MDEIMKALKIIQLELDDQKLAIRERGKNVTEQITQNIRGNIFCTTRET